MNRLLLPALACACLLLAACQAAPTALLPTGTPPPALTPTVTATPAASLTATPVPSPDPTATPGPTPLPTFTPPEIAACPAPGSAPAARVLLREQSSLWQWDEASSSLTPYATPELPAGEGAERGLRLSADGTHLAYLVYAGEPQAQIQPRYGAEGLLRDGELWTVDYRNETHRRIGVGPDASARALYPGAAFTYAARWLPGSRLLVFALEPVLHGAPSLAGVRLHDADEGRTWLLLQSETLGHVSFSPNLLQAAALTVNLDEINAPQQRGELILADLQTGAEQRRIPLEYQYGGRWQAIHYAPDSSRLAVFVQGGVAVIDAVSGEQQFISLEYDCIGPGSGWCSFPPLTWAADGQSFSLWTDAQAPGQPGWTITHTHVALPPGAVPLARQVARYETPGLFSVSPDARYALYGASGTAGGSDSLMLRGLDGSDPVAYADGSLHPVGGWSPDSARFLLTDGRSNVFGTRLVAGGPGQPLRDLPLPEKPYVSNALWLDAHRFLLRVSFVDNEYAPDLSSALFLYDLCQADLQPQPIGELPGHPAMEMLLPAE